MEGGAGRQAGPAPRGRIPAHSADNAKTGLNRDFFRTLGPALAPRPPRQQPPDAIRAGGGDALAGGSPRWARSSSLPSSGGASTAYSSPGSIGRQGRGYSSRDDSAPWPARPSEAFLSRPAIIVGRRSARPRGAALPAWVGGRPGAPPDRRASEGHRSKTQSWSGSIKQFAKVLARFEEGNSLRRHFDLSSGFWIARCAHVVGACGSFRIRVFQPCHRIAGHGRYCQIWRKRRRRIPSWASQWLDEPVRSDRL